MLLMSDEGEEKACMVCEGAREEVRSWEGEWVLNVKRL